MTHKVLSNCLLPIIQAEARWKRRRLVAAALLIGALGLVALGLIAHFTGWWSLPVVAAVVVGTVLTIFIGKSFLRRRQPDLKALAKDVEEKHPDLNSALLTALDMEPILPGGELGYLQSQVLGDVTEHAIRHRWVNQVSSRKLRWAGWMQVVGVVAFFIAALLLLRMPGSSAGEIADLDSKAPIEEVGNQLLDVEVRPGHTEVEKGSRLVVEASFKDRIPEGALLVITDPASDQTISQLAMRSGVDDSLFSAVIPKVDRELRYQIRFEEDSSSQFDVTTFEYPKLVQADATISPPEYTGRVERTVEDTRKVSVLEGSSLQWNILVNKPIASAALVAQDGERIDLTPGNEPTILSGSFTPLKSKKYRLELVDEKQRANKRPPTLTVNVKRNLPPKLKFTFPGRDVSISSVEEFSVEAKVWDDLGIEKAGIVFTKDEQTKEVLLAGDALPGDTNHKLRTQLAVEQLNAEPREVIRYYVWAEDVGPDGEVRRVQSDLFLAEIREYDRAFRE